MAQRMANTYGKGLTRISNLMACELNNPLTWAEAELSVQLYQLCSGLILTGFSINRFFPLDSLKNYSLVYNSWIIYGFEILYKSCGNCSSVVPSFLDYPSSFIFHIRTPKHYPLTMPKKTADVCFLGVLYHRKSEVLSEQK